MEGHIAHEGEEESIKEVAQREGKQIQIDRQQAVKGFPTKFLASGRVVGDFKAWNVVKDNRINLRPKKKQDNASSNIQAGNKFEQLNEEAVDKTNMTGQSKFNESQESKGSKEVQAKWGDGMEREDGKFYSKENGIDVENQGSKESEEVNINSSTDKEENMGNMKNVNMKNGANVVEIALDIVLASEARPITSYPAIDLQGRRGMSRGEW
ncbi:hypothetical protein KY284_036235 [Solanum tuberosum]|nr:hypothetical protein KY284_036235 [Solanum tuberosum]